MSDDWRISTIGAEATLQRGYDITREHQRPGSVPVISSGGFSSYHDTPAAHGPGVIIGRKGTLGTVFYVEQDYWPHDTTLWVKDFHGNHPRFVYYFFKSLRLLQMDVGSANPTLNRNHVHPIKVPWPPRKQQESIAATLGTLDDKIELNRKMNETLEEIARALFQSWFIDFGPVRAKIEGRAAVGMDPKAAALFPDSFQDSQLGNKPTGWNTDNIGSLTRVVGGSTPSTTRPQYWETGTHYWATPRDLSRLSNPVLLETERQITDAGVQQISSGLLPVGTVLLSSRAPIGYLAITEVPTAINQGFIALICDGSLPNHYVLQWLVENMAVIKGRANGTTFQEISKSNFRPISVIVPPREVLNAFTAVAEPLHNKLVANLRESKQLAEIRDALIPKLMSGVLRVRDAEKVIGAGT